MASPIRFAVVGGGKIGQRHAELIHRHPKATLTGIIDVDPAVQIFCDELDVPCYPGLEEFWARQQPGAVEVVNICTPNGLHAPQAIEAIEHNCHVVCEKPMGLRKDQCEEVIFKALQQSRHVFCVMQNRYSPPSVWLKEMMEQQRLGDIYMVQVNCFWNRDERYYADSKWKGTLQLDGGPLFTQFSHFVDMLYWLFGDIRDVQSRFENFGHRHNTEFEDTGFVSFALAKGGMGTFNYTTSAYAGNVESSLTVLGEKGVIKIGGQYMDKVELCRVSDYEMPELPPTNPPNVYKGYKGSAANHGHVIENVIDTLQGDSEITTNAMEGLKVVDIIERIYRHRTLPQEWTDRSAVSEQKSKE